MNKEVLKLKKEINFLKKIINVLPGNIYWKDCDGRFLGCNENMAKIIGLNGIQNVIGKTDFDLFSKDIADVTVQNDIAVMKDMKEHAVEEAGFDIQGKKAIYLSKKSPLVDEDGKVIGIIGTSIDITAQKEIEKLHLKVERLDQARKDAELLTEKTREVAFTIAHEMRTPLYAIRRFGEGIQRYIDILLETYQMAKEHNLPVKNIPTRRVSFLKDFFGKIEVEIKTTFLMINMLLENVKQQQFDKSKFEICDAEKSVEIALSRYPLGESQKLVIHVNDEHNFQFMGEPELFVHVLFNLLKNALHYIANKGEIFIWFENKGAMSELHFKDTGEGIAKSVLPHIFDRFYSRTYHGTGLGLSFCKRTVEAFGGKIICRSVEGEFTEFVISLPPKKSPKTN
ncbi:MAG: PAS domain-containing sensor histidine kinase [Proteobacteria bacterium]|nr:PAS domain-containing sensor histidine kinase [Pseudomonadota bacterium]